MGFNISILSNELKETFDFNSRRHIPKSYYYFVEGYEEFGEDSALIQAGKYYNLDTSPLGECFYAENEMVNESKYFQDIDMLIDLVEKFLKGVTEKPEVFQKVEYAVWNEDIFEDYATSGKMTEDLTKVLNSLQFLKENGCKTVYFVIV